MSTNHMIEHRRSLACKAAVGLIALAVAHLVVVVVAVALVAAPVIAMVVLDRFVTPSLLATVAGLVLLWALVPRREPTTAPGIPVDRTEQPELWDVVETIASAAQQRHPAELHLTDDVNAYVADIGGFWGFGGRRVMALGLPLMRMLDAEELGAVIAHELGHWRRGPVRFGPTAHRVRSAAVRALDTPDGSRRFISAWLAERFVRFTAPVAQAQESAADSVAASATSPRALAGAISRLPFGTVAYDVYLHTEYIPIAKSGMAPPFLDGFAAFLSSRIAREHLAEADDASFGATARSTLDAHGSVPERVNAVGIPYMGLSERPPPQVSAAEMIRDLPVVEMALVARHLPGVDELQPLDWAEVATLVLIPGWTADRERLVGDLPPGFHLGALPCDRDGLAELGEDVGAALGKDLDRGERETYGHHAARAIIGEIAVERGLEVRMVPGEPVWFCRSPYEFGLFSAFDDVVAGRKQSRMWFALLEEAGLTGAVGRTAVAPHGTTVAPPTSPVPPAGPAPDGPARPTPAPVSSRPPGSEWMAPTPADRPAADPVPVPVPAAPAPLPRRLSPEPAPALVAATSRAAAARQPVPGRSEPGFGDALFGVSDHTRQVFQVPIGMGRHQELVLHADSVTFRGVSVSADDIDHVAYFATEVFGVSLWAGPVELQAKMMGNGRNREQSEPAWTALVEWVTARVEQRLVERHLATLVEKGRVTVAEEVLTTNGIVVLGRVVPWEVLADLDVTGDEVVIRQRIHGADGSTPLESLPARRPDAVLLPALCRAAAGAARTRTHTHTDLPG
ncbi:MAG: M48 family metallopeptidase [Acidimicrobiia bacterium]|nr:M48 family metallopeptidase [Acidimicrobiia bacterium]